MLHIDKVRGNRMQSKWLEEQERVVDEFREKKRKQFPMVAGIICVMPILFLVIGFINGGIPSEENMPVIITVMGIIIAVIILALFLGKRQNNKQGCPDIRKNLEEILITQEEAYQFDSEMESAPLHRVELKDGEGEYYFTEHYLVHKFGRVPLTDYKIFKLSEVYSTKTISLKDHSSVTGLGKEYFTNLCDKDRKILGGITIKKKKQYEEFIETLQRFVPDVRLGEGR